MRRLPGILLLTGAALVVIAALLVSGLRIALPHLDAWRPEILNKIESATGMPVEASQLSAQMQLASQKALNEKMLQEQALINHQKAFQPLGKEEIRRRLTK